MNTILLGVICGVIFGTLDVLIMIPLKYDDKRKRAEAMVAAFIERFMIGFLIPNMRPGLHPAVTGVATGLMLSLPSAIITRAYAPILGTGIVGGLLIGIVTNVIA